jgi:hypothetical protein
VSGKNNLSYAVGGLSIAAIVTALLLMGADIKDIYYCPLNGAVGEFKGGLSASGERAYPEKGTTRGYVDCRQDNIRARWVSCVDNPVCEDPNPRVPVNVICDQRGECVAE